MPANEPEILKFEVLGDEYGWIVAACGFHGEGVLVKEYENWVDAYIHASRLNTCLPHRFAV